MWFVKPFRKKIRRKSETNEGSNMSPCSRLPFFSFSSPSSPNLPFLVEIFCICFLSHKTFEKKAARHQQKIEREREKEKGKGELQALITRLCCTNIPTQHTVAGAFGLLV